MLRDLQFRIRAAIDTYCGDPNCRSALLGVLRRPGYALHPDSRCRAGMFTLGVSRSIRLGSVSDAVLATAAAVEMQMEAAFMFDDVADGDRMSQASRRPAEEIALALALLECGSCVACDTDRTFQPGSSSLEALREFHRRFVAACEGQFCDARFEQCRDVTTDEALEMTSAKSGNLGRFAAGFGARTVTDDPAVIATFEEFGFNLFTFVQLVDDLQDACSADGRPDDLSQGKKTVPLVFYRSHAHEEQPAAESCTMGSSQKAVWWDYMKSGAHLYGALVAETFLQRAKTLLGTLRGHRCEVDDLERFVGTVEAAFQATVTADSEVTSPLSHSR